MHGKKGSLGREEGEGWGGGQTVRLAGQLTDWLAWSEFPRGREESRRKAEPLRGGDTAEKEREREREREDSRSEPERKLVRGTQSIEHVNEGIRERERERGREREGDREIEIER